MPEAISDTSPLLYLHLMGRLGWLPRLFGQIWIPGAVVLELETGRREGHDVPDPHQPDWLRVVEPSHLPSEWPATSNCTSSDSGRRRRSLLRCSRVRTRVPSGQTLASYLPGWPQPRPERGHRGASGNRWPTRVRSRTRSRQSCTSHRTVLERRLWLLDLFPPSPPSFRDL